MSFDPNFDHVTPKRPPWLLKWLARLAVTGTLLLLVAAFYLPAQRSSRGEAARRSQCVINLKQIGIALANYETRYGMLPPACTVDAEGRPLHSWRTLILPFLEGGPAISDQVDLARPWDDPVNAAALGAMPPIYRCPSYLGEANTTPYLAIIGPDACFLPDRPRRLAEITHGHAATLMVVEANSVVPVPWMAPRDADAEDLPALVARGSDHPRGTNAALADGSVRFLKKTDPGAEIRELGRITAGETKRPAPPAGPGGG